MILTTKIRLPNSYLPFIRRLVKEKQHLRNVLILIFEKSKDWEFLNYGIVRAIVYRTAGGKEADKLQAFCAEHSELLEEFNLASFDYFKNKIVEEIVDGLKANYKTCFKLKASGQQENFSMRPKKLSKVNGGSILVPYEAISKANLRQGIIRLGIYSKKHDKGRHFTYSCSAFDTSKELRSCSLSYSGNQCYLLLTYKEDDVDSIDRSIPIHNMGIDPGLRNHLTLADDHPESRALIIRSAAINRINTSTKRLVDAISSSIDTATSPAFKKKLIHIRRQLYLKRKRVVDNEVHKICKRILAHCRKYNIGSVVYGFNKCQKTSVNMGKKRNRDFLMFPHETVKNTLAYLLRNHGIEFYLQEESYTSKLSCLSDEVWKYSYVEGVSPTESNGLRGVTFKGKKTHALFKDKVSRYVFHSDVNGAINILQKYLKYGIDMTHEKLFNPVRIRNDFEFLYTLSRTEKAA